MRCILHVLLAMIVGMATMNIADAADKTPESKPRQVKWKEVATLNSEPVGCEFIEKVVGDSSSFFVFTGKQMRDRITKKLRKQAAKVGGNAYFVTDKMTAPGGYSYEAKVYWCEKMPDDAEL